LIGVDVFGKAVVGNMAGTLVGGSGYGGFGMIGGIVGMAGMGGIEKKPLNGSGCAWLAKGCCWC
jgi:hypothetical protein